jgi:hypothetical protein
VWLLAAIADHLWQSLHVFALAAALTPLASGCMSFITPWLWRACAVKLVVPFALLFAIGRWIGYPEIHAEFPLPDHVLRTTHALSSWFAPLKSGGFSNATILACMLGLLLVSAVCIAGMTPALRTWPLRPLSTWREFTFGAETMTWHAGRWRTLLEVSRAAVFAACALMTLSIPLLGGAVADQQWRHALYLDHVRALRDASVVLTKARPGMGTRSSISASANGVSIRNANIRELVAISNGISRYAVWTNQKFPDDGDSPPNAWINSSRYDVQIDASIRDPDDFDPFALSQRITRAVVERFGFELHVNGKCQSPCGRWDTAGNYEISRSAEVSGSPN